MFRPGLSALLMVVVFTLSHTVAATQMLLMLAWDKVLMWSWT
jgi:hypothetical protein